jgi:hypothetical protein
MELSLPNVEYGRSHFSLQPSPSIQRERMWKLRNTRYILVNARKDQPRFSDGNLRSVNHGFTSQSNIYLSFKPK